MLAAGLPVDHFPPAAPEVVHRIDAPPDRAAGDQQLERRLYRERTPPTIRARQKRLPQRRDLAVVHRLVRSPRQILGIEQRGLLEDALHPGVKRRTSTRLRRRAPRHRAGEVAGQPRRIGPQLHHLGSGERTRQLHLAGGPPGTASFFQQQLDITVEFGERLPFRRGHPITIVHGQRLIRAQRAEVSRDLFGGGAAAGISRRLIRQRPVEVFHAGELRIGLVLGRFRRPHRDPAVAGAHVFVQLVEEHRRPTQPTLRRPPPVPAAEQQGLGPGERDIAETAFLPFQIGVTVGGEAGEVGLTEAGQHGQIVGVPAQGRG